MSIRQMTTVFNDTTIKGNEKLLMLALADNSNDSGVCFPSWDSLMKKTSMSRGSISKHLKSLENKNIIFRKQRSRKNGSKTSNKYLIYPHQNKSILDSEDLDIFEDLYMQSSEVELGTEFNSRTTQSSEVELPKVQKLNYHTNHHYEPSLLTITNDTASEVSEYLLSKILSFKPNFIKEGNWTKDIEKAIRIDGRAKEQLLGCIDWIYGTKKGEFWIPNILSGKKLRDKFDTMEMQMLRDKKQNLKPIDNLYDNGLTAKEMIKEMEKRA